MTTIDPLVDWMRDHNMPLTRENYLDLAYPDGVPDDWGPELEAELPVEIQDWSQFEEQNGKR